MEPAGSASNDDDVFRQGFVVDVLGFDGLLVDVEILALEPERLEILIGGISAPGSDMMKQRRAIFEVSAEMLT